MDIKKRFAIYYRDREYARVCGDPCLGETYGYDKEEAEKRARELGWGDTAGVWAVELKDK